MNIALKRSSTRPYPKTTRIRCTPEDNILKKQSPARGRNYLAGHNAKLAEAYRSRTYLRPLSLTLVLKTRRNTGYETPPWGKIEKTSPVVKLGHILFPTRLAL